MPINSYLSHNQSCQIPGFKTKQNTDQGFFDQTKHSTQADQGFFDQSKHSTQAGSVQLQGRNSSGPPPHQPVGVDRDLLVPLDRGLAFARSPGLSGLPPGDWSWTQHTHAYRVHQALSSREFLRKRPRSLIKPSCGQIWPSWIALESAVNKTHTWHLSPGNINNFPRLGQG